MMPQHAVIPYLASVFQEPHLNWHEMQPNELSGARELAGVLIRLCRKDISSTTNSGDVLSTLSLMWDNLEQSVKDLDLETGSESLIAMVYSKRKLLKLSLECFRKLDSLDVNALGPLLKTATDELSRLSRFYTIGISFREVFLLSRDQTPPNHYREGIDILVHHLDDYEKWTATFSYQLAKAWFNKSTLKYYDKIAPINGIVRECYSNQSALLSKYRNANSQTSLCRVSQFSHRMEAIAFCEDYAANGRVERGLAADPDCA